MVSHGSHHLIISPRLRQYPPNSSPCFHPCPILSPRSRQKNPVKWESYQTPALTPRFTQSKNQRFYNNHQWSITFRNCESPYCTPVTHSITHQVYFRRKKERKGKARGPEWPTKLTWPCLLIPHLSDSISGHLPAHPLSTTHGLLAASATRQGLLPLGAFALAVPLPWMLFLRQQHGEPLSPSNLLECHLCSVTYLASWSLSPALQYDLAL